MSKIQIFVGSVMGTSLDVANSLSRELIALYHEVKTNASFKTDDLSLDDEIILICTSSTGMGDIPENIIPMYQYLINNFPKIHGRKYGIVALGDSSYPNFAQAGKSFDAALEDLGAVKIGETLFLDAILVDDYDAEAKDWVTNWVKLF